MGRNVAQKLIESHLIDGRMTPGEEIAIRIDQTLTQDATGTIVMLAFESMGVPRVRTELSAQYVDHNLLQTDFRNADDHVFLYSACRKFGLWYSRPGNGVSHPVHQERFGRPGKTLLGSDSHTPAAGAIGMLAMGAGGLQVAMAMAGLPYHLIMPRIWGVRVTGALPDWVSAKDVILEMLRRHGVEGGLGTIIEYYGPGLRNLSAMDRHVLANMGTELGATSTVFPSDGEVRRFLRAQGREDDWLELLADGDAVYDRHEEIDLSQVEPLIALPSSPGNVVPVREVEGREIYQSYVGSSANPGYRDFAVAAEIVAGRQVHERVSFDVNPTSRQILDNLIEHGHLSKLTRAGARLHQTGCNGCIGMGQAPATGRISLRTVPRNFPGRSGTAEDAVYLCSPETAAASALTGRITDPRRLEELFRMSCPRVREPERLLVRTEQLVPPASDGEDVKLEMGPNIRALPEFGELPDRLEGPVLLKVGNDVSTDEIMPAGARILPYRSNIPEISKFVFEGVDPSFHERSLPFWEDGFFVVAGSNYGQGSSREHAALAPRHLGLRTVVALSFARIHRQNLANYGILPLTFAVPEDYGRIDQDDVLALEKVREELRAGSRIDLRNLTKDEVYEAVHDLSPREVTMVLEGSQIGVIKRHREAS